MRNEVAFNREYIAGLNEETYTALHELDTLKIHAQRLFDVQGISRHALGEITRSLGRLERFHAPREIAGRKNNAIAWTGSACGSNGGEWEQWIQITDIPRTVTPISMVEKERHPEQRIMVGSDRKRCHIEWNTKEDTGFRHSHTDRHVGETDFLETSPPPPNVVAGLPAGAFALSGFNVQTANFYDNIDSSFKWYDDHTKEWLLIVTYLLEGDKYVAAINMKYLHDALSGFEEHVVTFSSSEEPVQEKGMYILKGSVRIDGRYEDAHRTAVIMTSRMDDEKLQKVMGATK